MHKTIRLAVLAMLTLSSVSVAQLIELKDSITTDLKLDSTKQYLLKGFFKVKSGAKITIPAGTVIYGDKNSKGSLIIERGAKIYANGTAVHPIIFTSAQPPGSRQTGDWGGILVAGNASVNVPGGVATFEGGVGVQYGGGASPNDDDSSGVLRYIRLEYSGIPFVPNSEINGLTLGGVGRKTVIEYFMVTENGDDSFEWFGGTVNGKYLISNKAVDDDFDTDFGFRGNLQYIIALRNPSVADISGSHAMECDNDGTGTFNTPRTNPTVSNATFVGPMQDTGATGWNPNFRRGGHWRRSTHYGLYNSIVMGWPDALLFDGQAVANAALGDTIQLRNTIFAGNKGGFKSTGSTGFTPSTWIATGSFNNSVFLQPADVMLEDPFNQNAPNFAPKAGSPALTGADFTHSRINNSFFTPTTFKGAIGTNNWTAGWVVWNPQNIVYTSPYTVTSVREIAGSGMPENYSLSQNYPNPFNPATVINFSLPKSGMATLKVYDMVGREVATLVNEYRNSGTFAVDFDASGLASGMYLYKLSTENFTRVKKMMLLK
jgi:hypothetical protein